MLTEIWRTTWYYTLGSKVYGKNA